MPVVTAKTWLKAKPAADRLGVTVYRLHTMALAGLIRTKSEVGSLPQFNAEDIDKLRTAAVDTASSITGRKTARVAV